MPPLKTFTFVHVDSPNIVVTISAYEEQQAWNILSSIGIDTFDFVLN